MPPKRKCRQEAHERNSRLPNPAIKRYVEASVATCDASPAQAGDAAERLDRERDV